MVGDHRRRQRSLAAAVAVLALLGWRAYGAGEGDNEADAPTGPVALGHRLPALPETGWIADEPIEMRDVEGKLVLLYFSQPGCGDCDAFTLHLRRLQKRFPRRFVALGIADRGEKELRQLSHGINSVYRFLKDPGQIYTRKILGKIDVLPAYGLVDEAGRLVWVDQGQYRTPYALEVERRLAGAKARKPDARGRFRALVVGCRQDPLTGMELARPHHDANVVAAMLRRTGFADVRLLTDLASASETWQATPDRIRAILRAWRDAAHARDQIVFFYTGSGLQQGEGTDTDVDLLMGTQADTKSLSLRQVQTLLAGAGCPTLMLLDIGHEDANAAAYGRIRNILNLVLPKTTVFFSCSGRNGLTRPLPEGLEGRSTRFTHFLVEALKGAGDVNRDRVVTAAELFRHVWLHMNDINRTAETKQTPYAVNLGREYQAVFLLAPSSASPRKAARSSTPGTRRPLAEMDP